jgi:phosphopantothenoylcysteine decarboxylase
VAARVLYVIVSGSPVARGVGRLVELAQRDGWDVCLVATPHGREFLDVPGLAAQTGHPVRWRFKTPGDPDLLPDADAMIVAPATFNTIAKWGAGIADTLALAVLMEGQGKGLPIVAVPFTNLAMANHPAFLENITRLRGWGIAVLHGQDVVPLVPPGQGEAAADGFPWPLALAALRDVAPLPRR